jgi:hypothetical protein
MTFRPPKPGPPHVVNGPKRPVPLARPATPGRPAGPMPITVQRYAWAVLDSGGEDNDIVRNNLTRFLRGRNIPSKTDTDIFNQTFDQESFSADPVHLHGHGSDVGFAGLTPQTLAGKVLQKFGDSLKHRSIVFHSCEIGQGNYLSDFLRALIGNGSPSSWTKTRVFGATALLVVNTDGISQVAKSNVTENQLKNTPSLYFNGMVQKKARGWRVALVMGNSVQVQDVTVGSSHYKKLKDILGKS